MVTMEMMAIHFAPLEQGSLMVQLLQQEMLLGVD